MSSAEANFRALDPREREVILALLKGDFPGRQALREQVAILCGRSIDPEGSLELKASGPKADVAHRVPVEAVMEDRDGVSIHILLHVRDGLLSELEIYKDTLGIPQRELDPEGFELFVPYGGDD